MAQVGGVSTFTCITTTSPIVSVEWLVNGTSFNSSQLHNVEQALAAGSGILRFNNVTIDDNNTVIQCLATTPSQEVWPTGTSLLRVQGI